MILSAVLSKEIISACLFNPDNPVEPQFYTAVLDKNFLIDRTIPVINKNALETLLKQGFGIDDYDGEIYLTSVDKTIHIPQIDKVNIIDFDEIEIGFSYILASFDPIFIKQHECKFEKYWNDILTGIGTGNGISLEILEIIDSLLINEALNNVVDNEFFVYSNPFNHTEQNHLSKYLKSVLKDIPNLGKNSKLIQINYDRDMKYFALSLALNVAEINPIKFFKTNPLPSDVNIFNLKGFKNFKIFKNGEDINEGIKPNKILTATTNCSDQIKFQSSSFKAEITDSILYIFDNRNYEE